MHFEKLLADRTRAIEVSGIRRVFDLAFSLKDPINLSIGQPHFPVPEPVKQAAIQAITENRNGYTPTQGVPTVRERIRREVEKAFPGHERDVIITSGTSGGLLLALFAVVNPGDEVLVPDPYFAAYPHFVTFSGGTTVYIDTYPDWRLDPAKVEAAITPRTKAILLCSPSNPTGAVIAPEDQKAIVEICREHGVLVISDEIYKAFHYDAPPRSPGEYDPNVLVIEGFGKTYGCTGWRLGYAHGPKRLIDELMKLQQYSYVCAPSMAQHAALAALDFDVSPIVADYKRKRDRLADALRGHYEFVLPGGAFYLFAKTPNGQSGNEFVAAAIERNLVMIPGGSFSRRDEHFRISYAASDETLARGVEILQSMARLR